MTVSKLVTRDSLQHMLENQNSAYVQAVVGRALVALFNRQTEDEQGENSTKEHNGRGFTGTDARSGSMTAKFFLKHKRLEDWQVEKWTRKSETTGYSRLVKYHSQLNAIAITKS